MLLITILNHLQKLKSFIYTKAQWASEEKRATRIFVEPRSNSRPQCGNCFKRCPGYDRLPARWFPFVSLWGIPVFLVYSPRRAECPRCRVKVESMPWTLPQNPKSPLTEAFAWRNCSGPPPRPTFPGGADDRSFCRGGREVAGRTSPLVLRDWEEGTRAEVLARGRRR